MRINSNIRCTSCHRYPSKEWDDPTIRLIRYVAHDVTTYKISASITPTNSGRVSGVGNYPLNSTVTLTAVANSGYDFVRWSDNTVANPRIITVTGNASYSAVFELDNDSFLYDLKLPMPESGEIDFLYTADIHVGWKNFGSSRWGESNKVFSLDTDQLASTSLVGGDVKAYQNKLITANIPTYLLDCGDWSKSTVYSTGTENQCVEHAISVMQQMDYFGITTGNWEFKWSPMSTAVGYLNRMVPYGLMACNINNVNGEPLYPGGVNSEFPGCKTIRIGGINGKRIAIIAVGYPSPNGFDTYGEYDDDTGGTGVEYNSGTYRWNYKENSSTKYRFYDSSNNATTQQNRQVSHSAGGSLYGRLQGYITKLRNTYNFDYIIVFSHMDKYSDENYTADNRFYSRADFTIMNTSGIDVLIPGHLNAPVENTYTYTWKDNTGSGIVAPEAGGTMNSFGRLRINLTNNTITCKLLTSLDDLRTI